jgi:heme/copper-type cytochrome/quinol oxidase subunit 1
MTDDRKSGIAFLVGSLGGIVTMAIHPTGGGVMTPAQAEALALASEIAHTVAMVSFLIMFLGAVGLTRRLARIDSPAAPDRLAIAAIVVYAFAAMALLIATAVSGFIVPDLIRHMMRDASANGPQWRMMIDASSRSTRRSPASTRWRLLSRFCCGPHLFCATAGSTEQSRSTVALPQPY